METFASPNFYSKNGWEVMIDNTSPFIGIPNYLANRITKDAGAVYDEETDLYYIDCDATPTFVLGIGNRNYTIEAHNLVKPAGDGICVLNVRRFTKNGPMGAEWIFGIPFMKQFCIIFDMGRKQIGLAPPLK